MACMLCGHERVVERFEKAGHQIAECAHCGLTQLHPLPSPEILDALYSDAYFGDAGPSSGYEDYAGQEAEYRATFAEEIRRFAPFAPGTRVLDMGCGFGYFIGAAEAAAYDTYGVDIVPGAVGEAARRFPGKAFCGRLEDVPALSEMAFDVIFMSHLIEHIPEPVEFLVDIRPRLREGGIIVLVTPDIGSMLSRVSGRRWVSYKIPEHVAYYNRETIERLLVTAGFRALTIESAYQHYRLPFIAKRLRELTDPISRLVPPIERLPIMRDRILRITSGSLRAIAAAAE